MLANQMREITNKKVEEHSLLVLEQSKETQKEIKRRTEKRIETVKNEIKESAETGVGEIKVRFNTEDFDSVEHEINTVVQNNIISFLKEEGFIIVPGEDDGYTMEVTVSW